MILHTLIGLYRRLYMTKFNTIVAKKFNKGDYVHDSQDRITGIVTEVMEYSIKVNILDDKFPYSISYSPKYEYLYKRNNLNGD